MKPQRNRDLAKIHIAKKQLGLDELSYREMLFALTGVESSAQLDSGGRRKVLAHLRACGFKGAKSASGRGFYPGRPTNMRHPTKGRMLKKIEALLAEAGHPWEYVHSIARNRYGKDRVEWCDEVEIHSIVAMLVYDAKRAGRYLG
jgi:phage gp16-like protein